jgi:hypothetical protein
MEWMEEPIECLERGNWLYRFVCFFLGKRKKKLTYQEMYMLLYGLNKGKLGEKESKKAAMNRILEIYKWSHNKLPNGI